MFDIVRVRTLWLAHYTAIAAIFTGSTGLKLIWFYLESKTKKAHFLNQTIQYRTGEIRGLYSRSFFWWINQLFVFGFKRDISVENLPHLDRALSSDAVHISDPNKNDGYGLIGAFALVFTLKAVLNGIQNSHETWASPTELAIAVYLLEKKVLWAAAIPAAISLSFFTSNFLDTAKSLKMLGMSEQASRIMQLLRVRELNLQKKFRHSMVKMNLLAGIPSNLSPVITLSVYTGIAFWTGREPLTEAQTFMTLSVILLSSTPLSNPVYSAPRLAGVVDCFKRIQEYLLESPRRDYRRWEKSFETFEAEIIPDRKSCDSPKMPTYPTPDVVIVHQADLSWSSTHPILSNISVKLPHGSLTMVLGPVGSGKSMLLKAVLGELHCTKGYVQIQSSLKVGFCDASPWICHSTILETICGELGYDEKWYQTVIRACALEEDINNFTDGYSTARTQLALFDDVLSALDTRTREHLCEHVFGSRGLLRQHNVTVVLVTHAHQPLAFADQVLLMEDGRISDYGNPQDIGNRNEPLVIEDIPSNVNTVSGSTLDDLQRMKPFPSPKVEDIDPDVHLLNVGQLGLWVQWWAEVNARSPYSQLEPYISVYAALAISASALWASCMRLVFCRIVPKSSTQFHEYLVTKIRDAPLSFLTSTDNGTILNRFSQDMTLVDRSLPADFLKTTNNFAQCLMTAVFFQLVVYLIQKFYLRTSHQLRQLDLEYKSPLYTQFTETVSGLITIPRGVTTTRWLILVLDLFVAGVAIALSLLAVFVPNIGPIGVSLISLITFSQQLTELVNFWTSMETSIGAITRIKSFQKAVPSENLPLENQIPARTWPSEGRLVFHNVSAGYLMTVRPVIRDISLTVDPGTKLGVCGRTGSGKSSLILTILRMIEIHNGDITIDDIIRNRVIVIPQEPVLLSSRSVRDNLTGLAAVADTTALVDDSMILEALEKVQLREYIDCCASGLDTKMESVTLSAGQKQLLCLARAIIMKRKILLLDEATSNVDDKTNELMQKIIRTEFQGCTIIAVAHRVHTLADFDMVAVMDEGTIVEYDSPAKLSSRPQSLFRQLCEKQSTPFTKPT
ncbi:ATP-binding cassette transporter, putative [Talaromyces stipitatus ATCC 10500]|uniref:ATP-binding cassette transporter, putative n=1 Tax=Talaromyces stipitatus (strain ATCC 10500 / CBS 375.48 / QM 6759 / NRRL 1006) TaxID=441959 RepID=B8MCY5_TALSN|nr:ATP-binding cassette transporter, putative [Talaromyces stipitatus ATCC 10500]EED17511.1 ATP-binding cassette transporter, putative [Talaromyces stipitatus ATCC 10500]